MAPSTSTAMRAAAPARRRPARRPSTRGRRGGGRRGRKDNWWPVAIVAALVLLGVAWARSADDVPAEGSCTVDGGTVTVSAEQARHATTIARVARDRGLPERAVVIALATAQQESGLRNLDYGDRDSLGLFQQRPSQGWGSPAQVRDPVYAAGKFYDGLVEVPGWETGRLTEVAQTVQRSGFPEAYQKHEAMAQELATALTDNALACT
ncbi:hypothetical protein SAMN05660662_1460 [Blastococcus aurantiacus]|uniref:Uncharacterized protein n=1 Tax=Blastococcus aurantiacus TaxID=1550231 RepID=A0A1G7JEB0_9ACTN|nr:hypothetical protein [Blastococcus aurantiacus]SDF23223.1 hypothetical protein SAMN05660662_1460 [Blastococcus aurantiacus]